MRTDITVKIGGEAGQGIQTIGTLLAEVCHSAGLFTFSIDDFESRIRGGHSFNLLRISSEPVAAPGHIPHILVAIDQRTMTLNKATLPSESLVILNAESEDNISKNSDNNSNIDDSDDNTCSEEDIEGCTSSNILKVALNRLAKEAGGLITANTVAAGAIFAVLGTPFEMLEELLIRKFKAKGEKIINLNITAAKKGYEAAGNVRYHKQFNWKPSKTDRIVISGAKAAGLGALASDCRFFPFYPMSPATGVIASVVPYSGKLPIVVEQAEDEIAAVNMAIGASFAGVRSMTSTSGGGFCLMTEGLGIAAMTETPLVIVDSQRPGPATGLPTRTAQPDLLFVINASQDDFPRFVLAPGTPAETFESVKKAFYLSEKYQVPAIVMLDQFLATSQVTQQNFFKVDKDVERFIFNEDNLKESESNLSNDNIKSSDKTSAYEHYKRYVITEDGISPRALPCMGEIMVRATGNEHNEKGQISEDAANKVNMTNKRNSKLAAMKQEMALPETLYFKGSEREYSIISSDKQSSTDNQFFLTGWGSSKGPIVEACEILQEKGINIGCIIFKDIWPMNSDAVKSVLENKKFIMVEQNSNCQMGRLIAQETGINYHASILKIDGRPFYPQYIVEKALEIIG
ncbi:MAG: 2-oxoacid:acceptor oxidoreductase subunit alpha [Desulfamplus sp.]|nr:2-oxoacid:acceptor oxidoreductase subunit alpha [Desulfamplus sp.]